MLEGRLRAVTNREKTEVTPNSVRLWLSAAVAAAGTARILHLAKPVVLGADRETKMTRFPVETANSRALQAGASAPMVAMVKEAVATTKAPVVAADLEKQGDRITMTTVVTEAMGRTSVTDSGTISASVAGLLRGAVAVAVPGVRSEARVARAAGAMAP